MRGDDRIRDRSPLRSEEHCESVNCDQPDMKKQKLAFGFGKKPGNEQKKGIQIKLNTASVSEAFIRIAFCAKCHFPLFFLII